jgi:pimeloyl-ACP methyl ester carboxylesterase
MKPVIFIPGIEATNLVDSNTFDFSNVWNAFDNLMTSVGTKITGVYIEQKLEQQGLYDEHPDVIVERYHMARLPYEKSIANIKAKINEGNKIPDPIYLFGYDWRLSNAENGRRLDTFIKYLQQKLKNQQLEGFRFLTHSMGALVFSCYLNKQTTYNHIDKVILCAPPFLGSPYAYIHMIKGDGGFKSFLNRVFGRDEDIRKVVRTYPSLYELLPVYDNALTFTEDDSNASLLVKDSWQENVYDDISTLFDRRLAYLDVFRNIKAKKNSLADLSALPADVRQRMVILVGSGDDTVVYMKADKDARIANMLRLDMLKDKKDAHGSAIDRNGDGTVPYVSSTFFKDAVKTLEIQKENFFDELSNSIDYHGLFLRDSRVQNIIGRFFTANANAANVSDSDLTKLKGKPAQMWYSIGDTVKNISPF